nr:hypothetical protein [Tanacetum cinerariifolium]
MLQEIVLLDLSSLVEAHLDYTDDDYGIGDKEYKEDMLNAYIYRLRHVNELKLGLMCSEVLSHLEAKGFVDPSNIKRVVDDGPESDEVDI